MSLTRLLLIFCLYTGFAQSAVAAVVCEPNPTGARSRDTSDRWQQFITDRRFDALDAELDERFQRIRKREASDFLLKIDLDRAFGHSAALQPLLEEWVKHGSESRYAVLVAGIFHVSQAYPITGRRYLSKLGYSSAVRHNQRKGLKKLHLFYAFYLSGLTAWLMPEPLGHNWQHEQA